MPTTSGHPDGAPGPAPASGAAAERAAVSAPVSAPPPVTVARGEQGFPVPPEAIAEAGTVAVCVAEDGEPARTRMPGGTHAVPVFTSPPPGAPADRIPAHVTMTLPALLDRLPSGPDVLFLSPSAPASLLLPAEELREQWQQTSGASVYRARSTGRSRTDSGTPSKRGQDE
ncbi:hypothetical protein [Streptomyces sp. wa53]|uniref:hypothetical protein n=1 Tax=Streptomyces sp. wa53 TaxID=1828268 RepID=UPI003C7C8081